MNLLLKIGLGIFAFFFILSLNKSCSNASRYSDTYNVTVQQNTLRDASAGLDLRAVGELVKDSTTAAEFERKLNDTSVGINNLDLDENGEIDYIEVTEYGEGNVKGFSLTTELPGNEVQEIATIEIEKSGDQARMQTYGNSHLYGNNHYYHSSFGLTDFLILSWLFNSNRPYYSSPWGYNNYPSSYDRRSPYGYNEYERRTRSYTSGSSWSRSSSSTLSQNPASPNANKNATNIKAPLKNPTTSQKSFQARNPSKQVRSGGFGRPSSSPTVRKTTSSSFRGGGK